MNKQTKIILFSLLYVSAILAYLFDCIFAAALVVILFIAFLFFKQKMISFKFTLILFFIFAAGLFNTSIHLKYDDDLTSFPDNYINVEAKVCSIPTNNLIDKTKFYARIISFTPENGTKTDTNAKTLITVSGDENELKNIKIGDTIELKGKIKTILPSQNPSQFDYAKYLQYRQVFTVMYVNNDDWSIKSHAQNLTGKLLRKLNDVRTDIISIHARSIKSPMLEVLGGIIFGDDAVNPDEDTKTKFINSGIFHILAASGMNVTLIFGIWFFFAVRLKFNYRFSIITGILLILFYTCMTGFGPPIIRAALMLTLILVGKLFDRGASTIALLFFVGFLMLLYNPLMLFDVGFQLSFIVTFSLILTSPIISFNTKYKFINNILGACFIPVIAQIYAMPLQMYYFNTFTMYSVFANIAIIPVLSIVSFLGFISSIIAIIPLFAEKVCLAADWILNPLLIYIVKTAEFFSSLPNSIIFLKKPLLIQVILYFSIVILISCIFRNKLFRKNVYILLSVLIISFGLTFIPFNQNNTEILFFSVGNADAILLKTENNHYFLIDTGKAPYMASSSQAKNIIIKYLKDKGIKDIHSLIITHFDADHAGGTIDILKELKVQNVYITDCSEDTKLYDNIISYIKENKINPNVITANTEIYSDEYTAITLLKPNGTKIQSENQKSIITHFKYKDNCILFMADADAETYSELEDKFKQNISVIKIGHHGAKNTIDKIMADNSDLFIISTGANIYGHPSDAALEILKDKKYYRTDYHNAVKLILDKNSCKKYLYSPKYHKFIFDK